MELPATDLDSPWKEALERYLPDCLALFLPRVHAEIDWARGFDFLDKELQQVAPEAALGRRLVDKLVQVWRRDGDAAWVLIHIEVQHQEAADFARRMFSYYYRLLDRFNRPVASIAILGDERASWRPGSFQTELWECAVEFRFPIVKLIDYQERWAELEQSRNPFAVVVMAHLQARATRDDPIGRGQAKLRLTRRLYDLGYGREEIVQLFRLVDWLLQLPPELSVQFWHAIRQEEEARQVTYITSVERIGMRKGLEQGLEQGLERGREQGRRAGLLEGLAVALELRFGGEARPIIDEVSQIEDVAVLQAIMARLRTAASPDEVRAVYRPSGA